MHLCNIMLLTAVSFRCFSMVILIGIDPIDLIWAIFALLHFKEPILLQDISYKSHSHTTDVATAALLNSPSVQVLITKLCVT